MRNPMFIPPPCFARAVGHRTKALSRWCLLVVLGLFTVSGARGAELKVATWNLNWLTTRQVGLPADVKVREPEDFALLRAYAAELNADIIAIQEVDNADTASRVFPPETWTIHMSDDHVRQRVGLVIRRGLDFDINPDVTAIALDPAAHLRSGVDVTVRLAAGPLRILAVHLKQGCQYLSLGAAPKATCVTLLSQLDVVTDWVAARRDEGVPFMLLGDFNRGMDKRDAFNKKLRGVAPMLRATEGFSSPCWGHEPFIDHILFGGAARDWVKPDSLHVMAYRETDPSWRERLSDHCPVSVRLRMPD
jgi:endonuclease/exonuclease/phosphatase family metal-dependent hydrolase